MIFDASATQLNKKLNIWEVKTAKSDFSFLPVTAFFLSFSFIVLISTCRTIQIFLSTYPPNLVEYFWYLQRVFKMIFDASETVLNKKFIPVFMALMKSPIFLWHWWNPLFFCHFPSFFSFLRVVRSKFFYQRIPLN